MCRSNEAVGYIKSHCPRIGSFAGDNAPQLLLAEVADELAAADCSDLFPGRYKEHVAYALSMVAQHRFLEPPAAIAAVYLSTRFEFFFRMLSGVLNPNGTWVDPLHGRDRAQAALGEHSLKNCKKGVSNVSTAYKLMKLNTSQRAAGVFDDLDRTLFATPTIVGSRGTILDIGERIAWCRHEASHGQVGDISSEAIFYGLVTAIIFYNQ
ncbi:MAG TPA: hypothetical protein VHD36_23335 [Pirellulales bacterium]|nr:hypothetical protein [Pirellulales bacterium]